jgi:hypothetical protein
MIAGMECCAAAGEGVDMGSWTQLTTSWLGIARMLGLERSQRPIRRLQEHLDGTAKAASPRGGMLTPLKTDADPDALKLGGHVVRSVSDPNLFRESFQPAE